MVVQITDRAEKAAVARRILENLTDWFGVDESRERYIDESREQRMFADLAGGAPRGFLCLKPTGADTVELAVMGVLPEFHRQGIGAALFAAERRAAAEEGFSFLQVKTVRSGVFPEYDRTNRFYRSLGFREFEVLPTLWDEKNPCQIYVMYLR